MSKGMMRLIRNHGILCSRLRSRMPFDEAVVPPVDGDDRDPMDIIDDLISRLVPAGLVAAPKVGLKRPDEDVLGIIFVPIIAKVVDSDAVDDDLDGSDDDVDDGLDFIDMEKIDFAGQPDLLQRYLFWSLERDLIVDRLKQIFRR